MTNEPTLETEDPIVSVFDDEPTEDDDDVAEREIDRLAMLDLDPWGRPL